MSVRCGVHTNWSTDKSGRCKRADFCLARLHPDCGETGYAKNLLARLMRTRDERLELEKELIS